MKPHVPDSLLHLPEGPETVLSIHKLRRGLATAYVTGSPSQIVAAIVQAVDEPGEPTAFGEDTGAMRRLLQEVSGWMCINVPPTCAEILGTNLERDYRCSVRHYGDVYHVLRGPTTPRRASHPLVRLLDPEDLPLLEAAPPEVRGAGYETTAALLRMGIVAGAVIEGGLVAIAHTCARTERYAEMGVFTLESFRGRGLSTAAAFLVAERILAEGQVPVWSAGEDNRASLRVAQKLGFVETSRRTYLIPDWGSRVPRGCDGQSAAP